MREQESDTPGIKIERVAGNDNEMVVLLPTGGNELTDQDLDHVVGGAGGEGRRVQGTQGNKFSPYDRADALF